MNLFYFYSCSLIVSVQNSKIPSLPLQMESYAHFSISFLIFWNSINLAYVSQLGNKDLFSDDIFTSQRESHSVPNMGFLLAFNYFVPFGVIKDRFTKINFKYFNGNCDNFSCPCWWILFLYAPPYKSLAFWKNLWASLSFSYSLNITYILLRHVISLKKLMVLSLNFTILILWSPVSFNPFISINEIGKYRSDNIV